MNQAPRFQDLENIASQVLGGNPLPVFMPVKERSTMKPARRFQSQLLNGRSYKPHGRIRFRPSTLLKGVPLPASRPQPQALMKVPRPESDRQAG